MQFAAIKKTAEYNHRLCLEFTSSYLSFLFSLFIFCRSRKRRPSHNAYNHHHHNGAADPTVAGATSSMMATNDHHHQHQSVDSLMPNHADPMNECNAALVLMSLSGSPHSTRTWANTAHRQLCGHSSASSNGNMMGSSPGGSSTSSWSSSESSSLSDEYATTSMPSISSRFRTTSLSMSDEGIGMDYSDETPRKRRVSDFF